MSYSLYLQLYTIQRDLEIYVDNLKDNLPWTDMGLNYEQQNTKKSRWIQKVKVKIKLSL